MNYEYRYKSKILSNMKLFRQIMCIITLPRTYFNLRMICGKKKKKREEKSKDLAINNFNVPVYKVTLYIDKIEVDQGTVNVQRLNERSCAYMNASRKSFSVLEEL